MGTKHVAQEEDLVEEQEPVPWYRNPDNKQPFELFQKKVIPGLQPDALQTFTFFPWNYDSLNTIWDGSLATEENVIKWKDLIDKFRDTIVICADTDIYLMWLKRRKHPLRVKLPKEIDTKLIHSDKTYAAWVLSPNAIDEPCVVISRGSLMWIYNPVHRGISSYLKGHGGAITSLAVHPLVPNLFCSTSRDHTIRIYDLTLKPHRGFKDRDVNPHWPPGTLPSRAGAAHGLHMNEPEGEGIGRCIVVLQGGRSGGHNAAVLGASFHPSYPVIATCGVDRRINIWHIHPKNSQQITREDKPLFSSSRIHRSRVLSVRWVSHDTLISHSPSATLRTDPLNYEKKDTYLVPGEIVVWQWLGLNRFFPPRYDELRAQGKPQSVLRGCASYEANMQLLASFTMKANGSFPDCRLQVISPSVNVFQSPTHDPVALCVIPAGIHYYRKPAGPETSRPFRGAAEDNNNNVNDVTEAHKLDEPESLLPPDEPPLMMKSLPNGKARKLAGTVTLVHAPSLPQRLPSRHPLDKTTDLILAAHQEAEDSASPKLSGLSVVNPSLIEREIPPPIVGWTLEVPLDDSDLAHETPPLSTTSGTMQVDEPQSTKGNNGRGKATTQASQESTNTEEDPIKVRLLTAGMGMDGKVIVVIGTRGRIWVYKIKK
ncbi:Coatomer subunit alpha [Leucoagaricus sp. SymC.cos]|nr:Coatomer subunit alpha [Leucoagaricus sp. SymC.cos]